MHCCPVQFPSATWVYLQPEGLVPGRLTASPWSPRSLLSA